MVVNKRFVKKSRKQYTCFACENTIVKGSKYVYMFGMNDEGDKPYSIRLHDECYKGKRDD